jgi:hypothetical protein
MIDGFDLCQFSNPPGANPFFWVYILQDPSTGEAFWVGKARCPKSRVKEHCSKGPCAKRIAAIFNSGIAPILWLKRFTDEQECRAFEWQTIQQFAESHGLLNTLGTPWDAAQREAKRRQGMDSRRR